MCKIFGAFQRKFEGKKSNQFVKENVLENVKVKTSEERIAKFKGLCNELLPRQRRSPD